MSVIVPAVLAASRRELEEKLGRYAGLANAVQIDVIDGVFATPASWPYADGADELARLERRGQALPFLDDFKYDIDLMVRDPEKVIGSWIALGASRITVHIESTNYPARVVQDFKTKYGHDRDFAPDLLSYGFAINIDTDMALLDPFINDIDYVQFMDIKHIGKQGEPFDKRVIPRITEFRKKYPEKEIQVDGGVNNETAPALLSAGVHRLVVGSALLYAGDVRKELEYLQDLTLKYGRYK
jgi:ribulose-phosphate 3-epimerase